MNDNKRSVKSVAIAFAVIVVAIFAVVIITDMKRDTTQNVQPDTPNRQNESGTNSGDGSINNATPNSGQSQIQDSEGTRGSASSP